MRRDRGGRREPQWEARRCRTCRRTKRREHFFDGWAMRCRKCATCTVCGERRALPERRTCSAECAEAAKQAALASGIHVRWARWHARPPARKHCAACDTHQPRDEEHFALCGRAEDGTPHYDAWCRPCRRAYQRDRYRADGKRRQDALERARRQRDRMVAAAEADPDELLRQRARKRAYNERQRRRARGEDLPDMRLSRSDRPRGPTATYPLPAAPLAEAVDREVRRRQAALPVPGTGHVVHDDDADREAVCADLGVSARTVRRWLAGEVPLVRMREADAVLLALGLHWWDVWVEDEHPEVAACLAA